MQKGSENSNIAGPKHELKIISSIVVLALALSIVFYALQASFFLKFWVDDAGISFTFARNIAEGYGSVASPGTERVEGFSNPLWVYLLAVFIKLGISPFVMSQILAYIFALGVLVLLCLYGLMPLPDGRRPWPVALGAMLVAMHASFVIWNQSGMENALYAFLIAASMFLAIRESRRPEVWPWSALTLFLLALTRPEGAAHVLFAGVFLLLSDLFTHKKPTKRLFLWAGSFLLLFGLYHLWHYIYYAKPFPNTYYAKVEPGKWQKLTNTRDRGWRYVTAYLKQYSLWPLIYLCLPAFLGKRIWREALYIALTGLFLIFFPIYSRGDWMEAWRFLSAFPIPLAMLLGLAAFNLGGLLTKLLDKRLPATTVLVIGLVFSAAWVSLPTVAVAPDSYAFVKKFHKKKETTVKMIARRARWWTGIANKQALRPEDTIMTDMDMGGTTYYWPGVMLDIGYLIDVPMATHRYTRHWARMMDEYYFKERRPEYIHVRRTWGKRTTIPGNRKFRQQYLTLPEDRKFGKIPNGNYVRRDLFESKEPPADTIEVEPFAVGLQLVKVEIPAALRPGSKVPIFLTWTGGEANLPACKFQVGLARGEQSPAWQTYEPVMGWLSTDKWRQGRYYRETVYLHVPKRTGRYHLHVGVKVGYEETERRALPIEVELDAEAAKDEAKRLLQEAIDLAERDAVRADLAERYLRQAEYILGEKALAKGRAKVEEQRLKTYLQAALKAFEADEYFAAAHALSRCWRIAPKHKALHKLADRVAEKLYEIGRKHQIAEQWDEAYEAFAAACHAQPQHAWARRRAEEVRARRY
ncbi:MAG: tetratricopeptide repeat protein [Alphaproteobacteria bacterium]